MSSLVNYNRGINKAEKVADKVKPTSSAFESMNIFEKNP
jgi:hypothetical protein